MSLVPVRRVLIDASDLLPVKTPVYDSRNIFLFDPDQPHKGPEQLLKEAGRMRDPHRVNHHCPMCCTSITAAGCEKEAMSWPIFQAHLQACFTRWRKVKLDITRKKFAGGSVHDAARAG